MGYVNKCESLLGIDPSVDRLNYCPCCYQPEGISESDLDLVPLVGELVLVKNWPLTLKMIDKIAWEYPNKLPAIRYLAYWMYGSTSDNMRNNKAFQ